MQKYLFILSSIYILLGCCSKSYSQAFTSSNLPIIVINTNGQNLDAAWLYETVSMGVIYNGPGIRNNVTDPHNNFNGNISIKIEGSSTVIFPKKSFRITTLNAFNLGTNVSLLGMPPHEDWVFKALYQDKSFLRDDLAFKLFNQMGHYSSRSQFFELVVDGDYRGVYQLEEKIKRDKNRVNISKLTPFDTFGDDLTGGYIISLDKFTPGDPGWYSKYKSTINDDSANYFLYYYPKPDSMVQIQKDYIKNYVDKFEDVLVGSGFKNPVSGYRKYIDVPSFIDNFIINELSRNIDGYRASTFFYKDKDSSPNGKLHAAPIWDFNLAWGNASYNGGNDPFWWQYLANTTVNFVPFWWYRLMQDSTFKNELKCRYVYLRSNTLNENILDQYIDGMVNYLNESQQRNFIRWPILNQVIYPNPTPVPGSYSGEISNLKSWVHNRLNWLDSSIPGQGPCSIVNITENKVYENQIGLFPNPFSNGFNLTYKLNKNTSVKIELINMLGERVLQAFEGNKNEGDYSESINTLQLSSGSYFLKLSLDDLVFHKKIIKLAE